MKLSLLPNAVYLFKPDNSTNHHQSLTNGDQGTRLSLDKFNKRVGMKQLV